MLAMAVVSVMCGGGIRVTGFKADLAWMLQGRAGLAAVVDSSLLRRPSECFVLHPKGNSKILGCWVV